MIHGIYLKNRPKDKWHLVALSSSIEKAVNNLSTILDSAKSEGYEKAEAVIQKIESPFFIPEYLNTVKEYTPQYN